MAGRVPIGSFLLLIGTATGLAYGLMAVTTPSDQQFYDSLAPDLKRKVDAQRALKQGAQSELVRESQAQLDAIKVRPRSSSPLGVRSGTRPRADAPTHLLQAQNEGPVWADAVDPRKK